MFGEKSGYDMGVNTFSPEGRIHQVEYAMNASKVTYFTFHLSSCYNMKVLLLCLLDFFLWEIKPFFVWDNIREGDWSLTEIYPLTVSLDHQEWD
jgi:hypothetical protein